MLPGMILSRGLGYYTELIISALLTVTANLTKEKKRLNEEKGIQNVRIL